MLTVEQYFEDQAANTEATIPDQNVDKGDPITDISSAADISAADISIADATVVGANTDHGTNEEVADVLETGTTIGVMIGSAEFLPITFTEADFILSEEHISQEELSSSSQEELSTEVSSSSPSPTDTSSELGPSRGICSNSCSINLYSSIYYIGTAVEPIFPSTSGNSYLAAKRAIWLKRKEESVKISQAITAPAWKKIMFEHDDEDQITNHPISQTKQDAATSTDVPIQAIQRTTLESLKQDLELIKTDLDLRFSVVSIAFDPLKRYFDTALDLSKTAMFFEIKKVVGQASSSTSQEVV